MHPSLCIILVFYAHVYVSISVHFVHAWYLLETEGDGFPGKRVTSCCELPCECQNLNPDPLGEQPVSLSPEPSLSCLYE